MIARLFPLRIEFPKQWTVPWPGFVNDMLKHHFMPTVRAAIFDQPVILRYLEGKKR